MRLEPTGALKRLDNIDDLDIDQTRTEPLKRLWSLEDRDFKGGRTHRGPTNCWAHWVIGIRDFCWGSDVTGALDINLYLYLYLYLFIFILIHILTF